MGFKAKAREWKRRIVHLLVIVLLLNNAYCLPVMAQTEGQDTVQTDEMLESVSEGDVMPTEAGEVQSVVDEEALVQPIVEVEAQVQPVIEGEETSGEGESIAQERSIESLRAELIGDTFYYEYDAWRLSSPNMTVWITYDDGTEESCTPFDELWNNYGLVYTVLNVDGNVAATDENGKYPIGDYVRKIFQMDTDVCVEKPVKVKSLSDIATKIELGETISGLSGTDTYDDWDNYREEGHYFQIDLLQAGSYEICKSANGIMQIIRSNGDIMSWSEFAGNVYNEIHNPDTYYVFVKGSDTFDFSFDMEYAFADTKRVTEIRAKVIKDTYFYERDIMPSIDSTIEEIEIVLDDGSILTCNWGDEVWNSYGIWIDFLDSSGDYAQFDENGKYAIADYTFRINLRDSELTSEVPVKVKSYADVTKEVKNGETISGLTGTSNAGSWDFSSGHLFKLIVSEPGKYKLSKSTTGVTMVEGPGYSFDGGDWNQEEMLVLNQPGTYYISVKGYEDFSFTVEKIPMVTGLKAKVKKDVHYYEIASYIDPSQIIYSMELMFDDGTAVTCKPYDEIWNEYSIYWNLFKEDGTYAEYDSNYKYPIGKYKFVLNCWDTGDACEVPLQIVSILDGSVEIPELTSEATDLSEVMANEIYKLNISKAGGYEFKLNGNITVNSNVSIYNANFQMIRGFSFNSLVKGNLGVLEQGNYYLRFTTNGDVPEGVTIQLVRTPELSKLVSNASNIVWEYGEWGYRLDNSVSGNAVNTRPLSANQLVISGRQNISMPIVMDGTLSDGTGLKIPFNEYAQEWRTYQLTYQILKADGGAAYTDRNGYLSAGDYVIALTAGYGDASVQIPLKVTGGVVELDSLTYSGTTQRIEYGTWGYNTKLVLSGNSITAPKRANTDLNSMVSGNNVLALEFELTGKSADGETDTISYASKDWDLYKIKTYFYDLDGKSVSTDKDGYIPKGSYIMKCVAYNGVECQIPFEVYNDATTEEVVEEQLSEAVDEMLTEAEKLTDESLQNATEEEKKEVVEEVLQKVEEIYEKQEIAEIGAVEPEIAIELAEKLTEVEEQIAELLNTSVTVTPQDEQAEDMLLQVKNALLSVPAGEDAEIKVTTVEVPENIPVKKENAIAIQLNLVSESNEKLQLNAPVIITINVPEGINTEEEVWVYHFDDLQEEAKEIIKAKVNDDGTLTFVTGSFSTFVIANEPAATCDQHTYDNAEDAECNVCGYKREINKDDAADTDNNVNDNTGNDSTNNDSANNDSANNDSTNNDSTNNDSANNDSANNDSTNNDSTNNDSANNNSTNNDTTGNDSTNNDTANNDNASNNNTSNEQSNTADTTAEKEVVEKGNGGSPNTGDNGLDGMGWLLAILALMSGMLCVVSYKKKKANS